MDFKILKTKEKDLDEVYEMICELEDLRFSKLKFRNIFLKNLENKNIYYFTIYDKKEIIGFVSFHIQNLLHHCGQVAEIQELFIKEKYRGKNIGSKIIKYLVNFSQKKKYKTIEVTVNLKRKKTHQFYSRYFTKTHYKFTNNLKI